MICALDSLEGDLGATMLYRSNVERQVVHTADEAKAAARRLQPEIVLVDLGLLGLFWWGGLIVLVCATGWRVRRRARRTHGAAPLAFDTLAIVGLMVCQVINGVTAEYMGAGTGAAAMMLYITGAWVVIVEAATERLVAENHEAALAARLERRSRPRPLGRARPVRSGELVDPTDRSRSSAAPS